jgi:transcriptional regulator with GAF, ATPase, and Fis domain
MVSLNSVTSRRSDLYYRLNVFPITIPPLRERPEDIVVLAERFAYQAAQRTNKVIDRIDSESLEALIEHCGRGTSGNWRT